MAFIDTAETFVAAEISQNNARYVQSGRPVEATFKFEPGAIHNGHVVAVLQALSTGQTAAGGRAVTPGEISAAPLVVRIQLDDPEVARRLPAGSTGTVAIFMERAAISHTIRRVILRQIAILNYVNPF